MKKPLVFTVIAPDSAGIVTRLAELVQKHDGNWLESRMMRLAGEFAGIIQIEIAPEQRLILEKTLKELSHEGITVTLQEPSPEPGDTQYQFIEIEAIGQDRPGIVAEFTKLFAEQDINLVEFDTGISEASMAGGTLFHANAIISTTHDTNIDSLQDKLHDLSETLSLDIEWTAQV